jgi:hypothetical protein
MAVLVRMQLFWNLMLCRWKERNYFFINGKANQNKKTFLIVSKELGT